MKLPSIEERIASTELSLARALREARKSDVPIHGEHIKVLNADLRRLKEQLELQRAKLATSKE